MSEWQTEGVRSGLASIHGLLFSTTSLLNSAYITATIALTKQADVAVVVPVATTSKEASDR